MNTNNNINYSNNIINSNENNSNNMNNVDDANNNIKIPKKLKLKLRAHSWDADYIIKQIIKNNNPLIFKYASKIILKNDKQFVIRALKANYKVMAYVKDVYKKDLSSLNALLLEDIDVRIVEFADPAIKNDEISMKRLVETKVEVLLYADDSLKKNTKLAEKILNNNHAPDCLKHFDPSILFKTSFMFNAIKKYSNELVYLAEMNDGFNNKDFLIKMAKAVGGEFDFSFLNDEFKNDADFMKGLLEGDNILKFDYLGESLKNNKDFAIDIFKANSKNLKLLKYFSKEIQNDGDVLVSSFARASKTNAEQFMQAFARFPNQEKLTELLKDKDFINLALSTNRLFYLLLNDELKNDPEFALIYLENSKNLDDIEKLGSKLQLQGDFLLEIKEKNPRLYDAILKKMNDVSNK